MLNIIRWNTFRWLCKTPAYDLVVNEFHHRHKVMANTELLN